jgi:pimeloyl-ACP methyl ester carboxylesterase
MVWTRRTLSWSTAASSTAPAGGGVYSLLTKDGYHVAVVQNPTLSLEGDVAATRLILEAQDGPVVLVGHSYGGAVITEAGNHDTVAVLVYIAAFAPDAGESVNTLLADSPPDAPVPPILPLAGGFLFLDRDKLHTSFAGDLPAEQAPSWPSPRFPGGERPQRNGHQPCLASQAQLVPAHHRGQNDLPGRAALHG